MRRGATPVGDYGNNALQAPRDFGGMQQSESKDDLLGMGGDMFRDDYIRFQNKVRDASTKQDRIFH